MLPHLRSREDTPNKELEKVPALPQETNRAWLERVGATDGILLLGGRSLAHFRVRVAQSQVRQSMLPSDWSLAGILTGADYFLSVPLAVPGDRGDETEAKDDLR